MAESTALFTHFELIGSMIDPSCERDLRIGRRPLDRIISIKRRPTGLSNHYRSFRSGVFSERQITLGIEQVRDGVYIAILVTVFCSCDHSTLWSCCYLF